MAGECLMFGVCSRWGAARVQASVTGSGASWGFGGHSEVAVLVVERVEAVVPWMPAQEDPLGRT